MAALTLWLGACEPASSDDTLPMFTPNQDPIVADAQVGNAGGGIDAGVGGSIGSTSPSPTADAGGTTAPKPDAQTPVVVMDAGSGVLADAGDAALPGDGGLGDANAPDAAPPRMDLGKGTGKDVITIGDSWMLLIFSGIQESLLSVSKQPYRTYAFPGTKLLDDAIPNQYRDAKSEDPNIKTVVMTGGGNDIIQDSALEADCASGGAMCVARLEAIGKALDTLWKQMSADGVQDVVHVMYSASAGSSIKDREANNQKLAQQCAAVPPPLRCHLLSTDSLIGPNDLRSDGIHPTDEGYDKIGKAVFDLMVKEGMRR